jgi:hypothetical protein
MDGVDAMLVLPLRVAAADFSSEVPVQKQPIRLNRTLPIAAAVPFEYYRPLIAPRRH